MKVLFCTLLVFITFAEPANLNTYILIQEGDIPILLTVPHGGYDKLDDASLRKVGVFKADLYTFELAESINFYIQKKIGKKINIVAAKFSRKYIDANRPKEDAFKQESAEAQFLYNMYHQSIKNIIKNLKIKYPQGSLLIDLHGQSKYPDSICRGTQDGKTITKLIKKCGSEGIIGTNSILGYLQSKDYKILPTDFLTTLEDPHFNGGYTVGQYGSHTSNGIDAIQLEVGIDIRSDLKKSEIFAQNLAQGICNFYENYLN